MFRKLLSCAVLIACSSTANADVLLEEGFESIAGLGGWLSGNFSTPSVGESDWFLGNTGIFGAQAGSEGSYIAANYLSAAPGGNVDNWLVTPLITSVRATEISFYTRTAGFVPGDNLEVLVNSVGTLDLADFVSLGTIASAAFPTDWTTFSYLYDGASANLRFAFRYTVNNTSLNGDYIGIDSLTVNSVPEPGTLLLLGAGLMMVPLAMRRRRRDQA